MLKGIFGASGCVMAALIVACTGGDPASPAEANANAGATANANAPSDTDTKSVPSAALVGSDDGGTGGTTDGGFGDGASAQGLGIACTKVEDCPSGFCTDGVCCNEACTSECRSCNQAGKIGTCSDVPILKSDIYWVDGKELDCANAFGFECNGKGACKLSGGISCGSAGAYCVSDVCTDGHCEWLAGEPCDSPADCGGAGLTCSFGVCK